MTSLRPRRGARAGALVALAGATLVACSPLGSGLELGLGGVPVLIEVLDDTSFRASLPRCADGEFGVAVVREERPGSDTVSYYEEEGAGFDSIVVVEVSPETLAAGDLGANISYEEGVNKPFDPVPDSAFDAGVMAASSSQYYAYFDLELIPEAGATVFLVTEFPEATVEPVSFAEGMSVLEAWCGQRGETAS